MDETRLDKWLWHARVAKTRTLARKLVESGHVRVNRTKVRLPARAVRVGDVLTISRTDEVLVFRVLAIAEKRAGFALASRLYERLGEE